MAPKNFNTLKKVTYEHLRKKPEAQLIISMKYLNLNIELSTFTYAYIPYGGILSCTNVQQIGNTIFKCVNGYVLTQEE